MGIGTKLYSALEALLKKQGICNLNACITWTEAYDEYLPKDSIPFHDGQGYEMVGIFNNCGYKFGRWYSVAWMEKMIGEHEENQPPVLPYSNQQT